MESQMNLLFAALKKDILAKNAGELQRNEAFRRVELMRTSL